MGMRVDIATLEWTLTGWRPFAWRLRKSAETGGFLSPDHGPFPARLPGSVQENLRRVGALPDWHVGRNSLAIEWVEHRHWMFTATLQVDEPDGIELALWAEVLDPGGWLLVDGRECGEFRGAQLPVRLSLGRLGPGAHELALVFDLPPEGQGQLGFSSRAREMKPRYSYGWDWCVRVVPIGAHGSLQLVSRAGAQFDPPSVGTELAADFTWARVRVGGVGDAAFSATLRDGAVVVAKAAGEAGATETLTLAVSQPKLWWPNGEGPQSQYALEVEARRDGAVLERWTFEVGFKHVVWRACAGAPADALPWLCVVNGRPIFLQGVNWTPVRMCYQDVTARDVERLVATYRDLGCNLLRVWGGAQLESADFYAACDRAGLLVWQEFALCSSGMDSTPPEDDAFVAQITAVARHAVGARRHHVSLLMWCGGNELHVEETHAGGRRRVPLDLRHPTLAALQAVVEQEDPGRRFLPTSPSGPRFHSTREEFGRGLHHEVHGPWGVDGLTEPGAWERYWTEDDALFRGEAGVAGASRVELIQAYAGGEVVWPPNNAYWLHASAWWTQWERLAPAFERMEPAGALAAYVEFTRAEQAEKLARAVEAKKRQFPRCGGFLIWMGHDAFPCPANTSLIEFDGTLKPAAHAVAAVFKQLPGPRP